MTTPSPLASRPLHPLTFLLRSLLPLAALLLLASTLLWGPYGFCLATLCWWRTVARIG